MSTLAAEKESLDPARVKAVADMLGDKPVGLGRPASDRAAWDTLAAKPEFKAVVANAEKLLKQPLAEQPDELFLEYSKNGNRTNWQNVAFKRRGLLAPLVLAECAENKGRFVLKIEELCEALCAEKTWVMPAHDRDLANFNGKSIDIDLASSALAWHLATMDWLIGEKLNAEVRKKVKENISRRALEPFRAMFNGERKMNWWMTTTNNWNAVCLAGVTGAGMVELEDRGARAQFIVAAEKYSKNFLAGFTPDGYCSEGLGYWNYGFGNYLYLAETIRQATGGKLDLLGLPEVKAPATFGGRIQIIGGVAPAFADCSVNAKPAADIMYFLNRRFGLGLPVYDKLDPKGVLGTVTTAMLFTFPNAVTELLPANGAAPELRTWFDKAGILISRPAPNSSCRMGVALKGGHNDEHHNHNDVGSFVVVVGDRPVLLDPGAETYTARTFSAKRYDSKLLNSFGHPVPIVAGKLQKEGKESRGKVLRTEFTDASDTLEFDIRSPYAVPELKSLVRTFVYSREKAGSLTVTDKVQFKSAQAFGTAILTLGKWEQKPDRSIIVRDEKSAVRVEVDAGGAEWTVQAEEIHENAPVKPTRIGINLVKPADAATITLRISPQE
jgi:hypothetical protein